MQKSLKKKKKSITIDDLARMVQIGFNETAKQKDMDKRFKSVDEHFKLVDERFDSVEERLARIENILILDHRRRIERLEGEMKELKEIFAVK